MAFFGEMVRVKETLTQAGVDAVIPDTDDVLFFQEDDATLNKHKRVASLRHIRRVRDPKTYGILVVNCDKHGIADYIGPNSFAEIAVALTHYKKLFLLQGIPEFYKDELTAWGARPLHSDLNKLITEMHRLSHFTARQRFLF